MFQSKPDKMKESPIFSKLIESLICIFIFLARYSLEAIWFLSKKRKNISLYCEFVARLNVALFFHVFKTSSNYQRIMVLDDSVWGVLSSIKSVKSYRHVSEISWFFRGADPQLISRQESIVNFKKSYLVNYEYLANLIELGEKRKLEVAVSSVSLSHAHKYLSLANYLVEKQRKDEKSLIDASQLYCQLRNTDCDREFVEFLAGKRVCVVGNSPVERGLGRGQEIDSHDVVIRFNNCVLDGEHINDYGAKLNVWVRSGMGDVVHRECKNLEYVIWEPDLLHQPVSTTYQSYMLKDFNSGIKAAFLGASIHRSIRQKSGLSIPSTGLIFCYYLVQFVEMFSELNLYGFAMGEQSSNATLHYFTNDAKRSLEAKHHNWEVEQKFFNEVILAKLKSSGVKTREL